MAALRLLLVASLALHACWTVLGTAEPHSQASEVPRRAQRSPQCPVGCPKEQEQDHTKHYTGGGLYLTPKSATVTVTYFMKSTVGHKVTRKKEVKLGSITHYSEEGELVAFSVTGDVWYCNQQRGVEPQCLPVESTTTTTKSTTTTTSTRPSIITTNTTTFTTSTTSLMPDALSPARPQGLFVFLQILGVASVLLWLLMVAKGGLAYHSNLKELNDCITEATVQAAATTLRRLHALRNSVVLDFGLRLCLCMLGVCAGVCTHGLYLVCTRDNDLSVALYIAGAACLLLHGYFCIRKVNSAIRAAMEGQHRSRTATRHHHHEEDTGSAASLRREESCPGQVIPAVLKVCLLLVLLCLCVLTYGLWHLLQHGKD